jgi:hypothetical protein
MDTHILETIDDLFCSSGWNVKKIENDRKYFRTHHELECYEIKMYCQEKYKLVIPLSCTNYSVRIFKDEIYDYIYEHLGKYM